MIKEHIIENIQNPAKVKILMVFVLVLIINRMLSKMLVIANTMLIISILSLLIPLDTFVVFIIYKKIMIITGTEFFLFIFNTSFISNIAIVIHIIVGS